ncbi:protein kinase, partial [Acidobacteriota bacterium]
MKKRKKKPPKKHSDDLSLDLGLSVMGSLKIPAEANKEVSKPHPVPSKKKEPISRYRILREIDRDDDSATYLAFDKDLNRKIALKIAVQSGSDPINVIKHLDQAQVAGQLEHQNIVPVHNLGATQKGEPFYTMRHVRGKSLAQVLRALKHRSAKATTEYSQNRLLQVLMQVCWAIEYAHQNSVSHQSLTPDTIMLGEYGEVTVIGWDRARVVSNQENQAAQQSDIHAFGAILQECLDLQPSPISEELERICSQALNRAPDDRFNSAREVGTAIQRYLELEKEQELRSLRAEELLAKGKKLSRQYEVAHRRLHGVERRAETLKRKYKTFDSYEKKKPYHQAVEKAETLRIEAMDVFNRTTNILTFAPLGFESRMS